MIGRCFSSSRRVKGMDFSLGAVAARCGGAGEQASDVMRGDRLGLICADYSG